MLEGDTSTQMMLIENNIKIQYLISCEQFEVVPMDWLLDWASAPLTWDEQACKFT